eukprot:scaffold2992_cov214-Amphora_coffeaeformis.AAC.52
MANDKEMYGTMLAAPEEGHAPASRFRRPFFRRTKRTIKEFPNELDALLLQNNHHTDNDDDDETIQTIASTADESVLPSSLELHRSEKCEPSKLLDLESLLGLCIVRLKLPSSERHLADTMTTTTASTTDGTTGSSSKGPFSRVVGRSLLTKSLQAPRPSSLLLKFGRAEDNEVSSEDEKPQSGCAKAWESILGIVSHPFSLVWSQTSYRVMVAPVLLFTSWILTLGISSSFLGPIWFFVDLALPYLALGLSLVGLLVQSWVISLPLARSIINVLSQLQSIIDEAFLEMVDIVPSKISKLLLMLKIPGVAADNICRALFLPLKEVLKTILKIMPKVDEIVPANAKEPKPLAFAVFLGLLVALFFGQALMVLVMGTMLNGTMEIVLGVAICCALGALASYADNLVSLFLRLVEAIVNGIIQSLLRKLLPVSKLQRTLDYIERIVPKPSLHRNKRKRNKRHVVQGRSTVVTRYDAVNKEVVSNITWQYRQPPCSRATRDYFLS